MTSQIWLNFWRAWVKLIRSRWKSHSVFFHSASSQPVGLIYTFCSIDSAVGQKRTFHFIFFMFIKHKTIPKDTQTLLSETLWYRKKHFLIVELIKRQRKKCQPEPAIEWIPTWPNLIADLQLVSREWEKTKCELSWLQTSAQSWMPAS